MLDSTPKANYQTPEEAESGLFFYAMHPDGLIVQEAMVLWQVGALETAAALEDSSLSNSRKHVMSFRLQRAIGAIGSYLAEEADALVVNVTPDSVHPGTRLADLYEEFGAETDGTHQRLVIGKESIGAIAVKTLADISDPPPHPLLAGMYRRGFTIGSRPVVDVRIVTKDDKENPLHLHEGTVPSMGRWSRFPLEQLVL